MTNEQIFYLFLYFSGLVFFYLFWYDISFYVSGFFLKIVRFYDYEIELIDNIKETMILWYDLNIQELIYICGLFIVPAFILNSMFPLLLQFVNVYFLKFIVGTSIINGYINTPQLDYEFMCNILNSFPFQVNAVTDCIDFIRQRNIVVDGGIGIFTNVMPCYRLAYLEFLLGWESPSFLQLVREVASPWGLFFDPTQHYERLIEWELVEYALLTVDVNHFVSIYEMIARWELLKLYMLNGLNYDVVYFTNSSVHSLETYKEFVKFLFRYIYGIRIF